MCSAHISLASTNPERASPIDKNDRVQTAALRVLHPPISWTTLQYTIAQELVILGEEAADHIQLYIMVFEMRLKRYALLKYIIGLLG